MTSSSVFAIDLIFGVESDARIFSACRAMIHCHDTLPVAISFSLDGNALWLLRTKFEAASRDKLS